jgi:hypothetical protein
MVNAVAEDQILKIHRAGDGSIWYIEGARAVGLFPPLLPPPPPPRASCRMRLAGGMPAFTLRVKCGDEEC